MTETRSLLASVIKVPPQDIAFKVSLDFELSGVVGGDWDIDRRLRFDATAKYRSVVQHFVDGVPWAETELFRTIYAVRFARGETSIRGCQSLAELAWQYDTRVDALFFEMGLSGFRIAGPLDHPDAPIPDAYVGRDGAVMLGNDGNHRVAMAKVLDLPFVLVRIKAIHQMLDRAIDYQDVKPIPAMTTPQERARYYARARATLAAGTGAVIEFGAWLGASTSALAAAVRDSAVDGATVHVYDRFAWKPEHSRKAREFYGHDIADVSESVGCLAEFKANLGDLLPYVTVHKGEIKAMKWNAGPIGFVLFDAPKRVPEISLVLSELAPSLDRGAVMAWQDFAHFPSYEIVACLSRLVQSEHVKCLEAVYPGTTMILQLRKGWTPGLVSQDALALKHWTATEIYETWESWSELMPEAMRPRFLCGAAMFLCDIGEAEQGRAYLRKVKAAHADAIMPKWQYLREQRAGLMARYAPLAAELWG